MKRLRVTLCSNHDSVGLPQERCLGLHFCRRVYAVYKFTAVDYNLQGPRERGKGGREFGLPHKACDGNTFILYSAKGALVSQREIKHRGTLKASLLTHFVMDETQITIWLRVACQHFSGSGLRWRESEPFVK